MSGISHHAVPSRSQSSSFIVWYSGHGIITRMPFGQFINSLSQRKSVTRMAVSYWPTSQIRDMMGSSFGCMIISFPSVKFSTVKSPIYFFFDVLGSSFKNPELEAIFVG
jgi:hypothetical protein